MTYKYKRFRTKSRANALLNANSPSRKIQMWRCYMKQYITFAVIIAVLALLNHFRGIVTDHRNELEYQEGVKCIDMYVQRMQKCRLAYPRANGRQLHECATD